MHDTAVLRSIADRVGAGVYYFSDDFRQFFYQIKLRTECLWYSGIMIVDPADRSARIIVELGMAMGFTPCSNIAQMVCDAVLWIFTKMMAAAELAADDMDVSLRQIMEARRRAHGYEHGLPWTTRGYTGASRRGHNVTPGGSQYRLSMDRPVTPHA